MAKDRESHGPSGIRKKYKKKLKIRQLLLHHHFTFLKNISFIILVQNCHYFNHMSLSQVLTETIVLWTSFPPLVDFNWQKINSNATMDKFCFTSNWNKKNSSCSYLLIFHGKSASNIQSFSQELLERRQGRHCYDMLGQSIPASDTPYIEIWRPGISTGCWHEKFEVVAPDATLWCMFKQIIHCNVTFALKFSNIASGLP